MEKQQTRFYIRWLLLAGILCQPVIAMAQEIDAVVDWSKRVALTIPVEGLVKAVNVRAGQHVKKGETMVALDARVYTAELRKARAAVASLKLDYEESRRELERAEELYERTVLSDHELQVAKNNYVKSEATYEAVKSNQVKAQYNLDHSSLRAPFDGIVLARQVEKGKAIINTQMPEILVTFAATNTMYARGLVDYAELQTLTIGQAGKVMLQSESLQAVLVAISYEPEGKLQKYETVWAFKPGKRIPKGIKVRVKY